MTSDYLWIEAFAEISGRKCSEDEQLLILSQFSQKFNQQKNSGQQFMETCRRQIGLPPRLNDILNCLLESLNNKEIASKLGISHHTVNDYVKQVLNHYMVSSRRELLAAIKNGRLLKHKNSLESDTVEEKIFHILSDLLSMDINICERRRYFFDHFIKILGADSYIWYESEFDASMQGPKVLNVLTNFPPEIQQLFFSAANDPKLTDPYMVPSIIYHYENQVNTYLRQEILSDEEWYASEYTQKYYKQGNIDHPLCFNLNQEENLNCGIMFFRKWQDTSFSIADKEFIDAVLSRLSWLFLEERQIDKSPFQKLTAHQHKVLLFLIDGYGKKELANHLCISENTANDHIKKIYKTFQVKSYGELIKLFIH